MIKFLDNTKQLYWDYVNGKITEDNNFAKILPNPSEFYIEQYELYDGTRINFTYTEIEKKYIYSWFLLRKTFFEEHKIKENEIKRLIYFYIPYSIYKGIINEYTRSN